MEDRAISLNAVLEIVNNPLNIRLEEIIKQLPSVTPQDDCDTECIYCKHCFEGSEFENATPQPKTGHWIMTNDYLTTAYGSVDYVKCSCCGEDSLEEGNFCPNCGTEMVNKG